MMLRLKLELIKFICTFYYPNTHSYNIRINNSKSKININENIYKSYIFVKIIITIVYEVKRKLLQNNKNISFFHKVAAKLFHTIKF